MWWIAARWTDRHDWRSGFHLIIETLERKLLLLKLLNLLQPILVLFIFPHICIYHYNIGLMNMNISEKLSIHTFINTPACYHPRGVNECRFVRAAGVVFLGARCHLACPDTQGYGISTQNASFEMKTLCILTQTVTFSYTSINLSASTGHKPGSPRCCGARQFRFLFRLFSFFKLCHFLWHSWIMQRL